MVFSRAVRELQRALNSWEARQIEGDIKHYQILDMDLDNARDDVEQAVEGDTIQVESITGALYVRVNSRDADKIDLRLEKRIFSPFSKLYWSNTAQAGKEAKIVIGGDASFETEPVAAGNVGLRDTDGTDINPTTLEESEKKLNKATTPVVVNVTMTNADTEYSSTLPASTKKFLIHTRDGTAFRIAFVTGKVAAPTEPYFTIPINTDYNEDFIEPTALTLYFACAEAAKVAEIVVWS